MTRQPIPRDRGDAGAFRDYQLAAQQLAHRRLHRALDKPVASVIS